MPRDSPLHCGVTDEPAGLWVQLNGRKNCLCLVESVQLNLQGAAPVFEEQLNDEKLGRHHFTSLSKTSIERERCSRLCLTNLRAWITDGAANEDT